MVNIGWVEFQGLGKRVKEKSLANQQNRTKVSMYVLEKIGVGKKKTVAQQEGRTRERIRSE